MRLDITHNEQRILIDLLEFRVRELHPTIRRSRVSTVTDELKHDLEDIERLLEKVRGGAGEADSQTGA